MMRLFQRLVSVAAKFARDGRGVAVVEFALVVPAMLTLYVGAMEASMLITMDRKVQSVAGAVGDLVARTEVSVSSDQLRDYFQAASGIMIPYTTTGVKQLVTLVEVSTSGATKVIWSREYLNGVMSIGTTHKIGAAYTLPEQMTVIAQNSTNKYVVASEAVSSYKPLYGLVFDKAIPLYRENFYTPRSGKTITTDTSVK